jgi:hypothetical protein
MDALSAQGMSSHARLAANEPEMAELMVEGVAEW